MLTPLKLLLISILNEDSQPQDDVLRGKHV